ncbi:VOC family protein [Pedobacter cryophilus]|uniref:VOC family protein n=1 Tax=Pedobacter cryophilus TaxID=2571271 RepID=A0A4U1C313_9SPHI|nr:VOC family protein [Pedobacter cryophilus]TKC00160.1 VOC family protein [Pedobacter cryophilus]
MTNKENSLNWFEISVTDINRAKTFYEAVFGIKMDQMEMMDAQMAFFPMEEGNGKASGALVQSTMHKPSAEGAIIYLNANPDLSDALSKIEPAGGKITMPKTPIGEFGFMAFFMDTEGNSVALHSNN